MSSKRKRRRLKMQKRKKLRSAEERYMTESWNCPACGGKGKAGFPVCICGYVRGRFMAGRDQ